MTKKTRKKLDVPPVGLHIQAQDGSYVRGPDGIVDPRLTLRDLAAKADAAGLELHFQIVKKPPPGTPRNTTATFPPESRRARR